MSSHRPAAPRGTRDVLPDEGRLRARIVDVAREAFERHGYGQIITPTFEETEVFVRGVGTSTDIVRKEMYTFDDRSGRSLTLRPEGTAPVMRAFVEHGMHKMMLPVKLWYMAPMFRYEAPQAGRYREHWQLGAEAIGSDDPLLDAEVIALLHGIYAELQLPGLELLVGSMGDPESRGPYRARLVEHLDRHRSSLDADALDRMRDNPLRLFDSKDPAVREVMRDAPKLIDHLSPAAQEHRERVLDALDLLGIAYTEDPTLVRGFDYYTMTVFEFTSTHLGAQSGVGGGGRYDGLVEQLGGPPTPGIGFGTGIERITLALQHGEGAPGPELDCYLAVPDPRLRRELLPLLRDLRAAGLRCESDQRGRGMKAMMKHAASLGARRVVIIGPREYEEGTATVRDMTSGEQIGAPRFRSHACEDVVSAPGERVRVAGWVHRRRDHGGVVFIDLRDRSGLLQLVFHPDAEFAAAHAVAGTLSPEDVVCVEGTVVERSAGTVNPALPTGTVELRVDHIELLAEADPLPFSVEDETQEPSEELRLAHRYLDIRRPRRLRALELRARVVRAMRRVLDDAGFLEVETPVLTRSTPEGARDFLVPSRMQRGSFYALPQSPQLFKQILMVGGIERYYQVVRCFRDEDLRADRQPEFTQLDIEASFVEPGDIQALIENVLRASFAEAGLALPEPFPMIAYAEAMRRFGTDRPDVRFGLEIQDWTEQAGRSGFGVFEGAIAAGGVVRGLVVPQAGAAVSRKVGDELMAEARELGAKGLVWAAVEADGSLRSPVAKFLGDLAADFSAEPGDLIAMVADAEPVAQAVLGAMRVRFAERHGLIPEGTWAPLWVVDFPLVEWNADEGRWEALHHPFTAPRPQDLAAMEDDPGAVLSLAYDIVLNGLEIGGGSIRIHDRDVQRRVFTLIGLGDEEAAEKFGFLLDALRLGAPPHGGIALGLDRLVMLLAGERSIRDVIAFPKTATGHDPLSGAPSSVDEGQLRELGVALRTPPGPAAPA